MSMGMALKCLEDHKNALTTAIDALQKLKKVQTGSENGRGDPQAIADAAVAAASKPRKGRAPMPKSA
jgi:hypothetical protein